MNFSIKQISSLEKVESRNFQAFYDMTEVHEATAMCGERVSYQIALCAEDFRLHSKIWAETDLACDVKLFRAADVPVDNPSETCVTDENYILNEPGILPDVLLPIEKPNNRLYFYKNLTFVWVKLDIPVDTKPGRYSVTVHFDVEKDGDLACILQSEAKIFNITVVGAVLPKPDIIYTRWFYLDCIADAHNVEVFSEAHWTLIDKYVAAAADSGINMLLVPVHTPPLDTEVGTSRPCVQLVDIEKNGEIYSFDFEKFDRYIAILQKHEIKYFEMAHMFSQWGADFAPNIKVTENGVSDYMFGWHVAANDERYVEFLKQYISAIYARLELLGIAENTYFHISDEPHVDQIEKYRTAFNIFKPLIGKSKIFDALSNYEFYENGLVECPVTSIMHIHQFLEHNIENQWVYYCCHPVRTFTNSFIAMPSARIRILGLLIYKYNIKGFLHWGLNFYNAARSKYKINPYLTTSADGAFSSGDAFILYPGRNEVYGSTRAEIIRQAFEDIAVCQALEKKIGREAVVKMIDKAAGRNMRFDDYPCDNVFLENLRKSMVELIAE